MPRAFELPMPQYRPVDIGSLARTLAGALPPEIDAGTIAQILSGPAVAGAQKKSQVFEALGQAPQLAAQAFGQVQALKQLQEQRNLLKAQQAHLAMQTQQGEPLPEGHPFLQLHPELRGIPKEFIGTALRLQASTAPVPTMTAQQALQAGKVSKGTKIINPDANASDSSLQAIDALARSVIEHRVTLQQLPGFGQKSIKARVAGRVAELAPDFNFMGAEADFESKKSALASLEKQKNAAQNAARTSKLNMDLALDQSAKLPRSQSPLVNRYIQWTQGNISGNPELTKFENYIYTASREYAKTVSGSAASSQGLTDAANKKAGELLGASLNPAQFSAALQAMKDDMDNISAGFDMQVGKLSNEIRYSQPNQVSAPALGPTGRDALESAINAAPPGLANKARAALQKGLPRDAILKALNQDMGR